MPRVATSAKFPATLLVATDIGLFTNDEDLVLTTDESAASLVFDADDVTQMAIGMWIAVRGVGGLEVVQVTAVDLALNQVTVTRAKDGTTAIAHAQGERGIATIPAVALNQMRDELVAHAVFLTPSGGAWTPGSVLFIGASGSLAQDNANFFWHDTDNQLRLAATGSTAGLLLGGDAHWYRGAANGMYLASGDSLNIVLGAFQMAGTTLFESDRDLAVSLLPNADNTLNLGSSSRRFAQAFVQDARILAAASDANPVYQLSTAGFSAGAGGASAVDVVLSRGAANRFDVAAGDSLLIASDATGSLLFGAAADVGLSRGAADRLDLATGDSFNIVLGTFQIAATTVFESDRDLAVSLLPNADNTLSLGSTARNWANLYLKRTTGSVLFMGADGLVTEDNAGFFYDAAGDQLRLPTSGSGAGILLGGDALLYRGAADRLQLGTGDVLWSTADADTFAKMLTGGFETVNSATSIGALICYVSAAGVVEANPRFAIYNQGVIEWGAGGASALDIQLSRGGANRLNLASGDSFRLATDGSTGALQFGASGDAQLFRGAANRLDLASGDSFNIVLGDLMIAATTLFESDRDLAVDLIPNADGTLDLGSSSRRFTEGYVQDLRVLNAASDANPKYRLTTTGLSAGAGGASAPDLFIERVVPTANTLLHIGAAAGGATGFWVDATTPGFLLRSPDNNYWRFTVDNSGALLSTSIGASLP